MRGNFFIDSGSGVSLVSPIFLAKIQEISNIQRCSMILSSFTQNEIPIRGKIELTVRLADVEISHEYIVTDLLDTDFLIGLDFLHDHGITINFNTNDLITSYGTVCRLHPKPMNIPRMKRIKCEKTVTLAPNSAHIISGKAPRLKNNYLGITDPCHNTIKASGAIIGPSLVHTQKSWVPIQCFNITDEPIVLYRGSTLGFLKPASEHGSLQGVKISTAESRQNAKSRINHITPAVPDTNNPCRWTKETLFQALKLNQIEVSMTKEELARLQEVLWKHRSCFAVDKDDFGRCNMFESHIQLKQNHIPSWTPERKVPYHLEHHMDKLLGNMLDTGVVEPLKTDSRWNSPLFLVAKSTPDSYRVVSDLRGVNKQCVPDKYDLPNLNYVLDKIGGDSMFSTFDMAASFHQVPYDEDSKPITAFTYKGKRYNFARMIMGHCDSSAAFSKMMHKLLAFTNITNLVYFLDDLLIGSKDVASHIDRLEILLKQLESANLKLTPSKTSLLRKKVQYVGVTLSSEGININEDRVKAIMDLPAPSTKKETQRVLGTLGYNRRFVKGYSAMSKPLYDLLRRDTKFLWTTECQRSFEQLKAAISTNTTLCFPDVADPKNSYQVEIDASQFGLASTLSQVIDGERRIVGYFSKSVPRHKKQWGQTKLEFESLCASLKHWDVYLRGAQTFKVVTDCKSLLNLDTIFKNNPTMIRRFEQLSNYNFVLEHIAGKLNLVPDFLSRFGMKVKEHNKGTQTEELPELQSRVNQLTTEHTEPQETVNHSESPQDNQPSDLARLFLDDESDSVVTICNVTISTTNSCHCNIPEMENEPRVRSVRSKDPGESVFSNTTEVIPNRTKIRLEQDKDKILSVVKDWIKAGEKPKIQTNRTPAMLVSLWKQFSQLTIAKDGLLLRKWVSTKDADQGRNLIVIPENQIEEIMKLHHSTLASCHPGVDNSVDLCRRKFYWPKMVEDFKEYIAACEKCSAIKQPQKYLKAPLRHMLFHSFNDCIIIDHIVPESEGRTPRGYRYILTITDAWSNYVVAIPVKTQTAKDNIQHIVRRWVLTFGMPKEIIVDNHPGFRAEFFKSVWNYFDCKVTHGTSYKSRSTGKAERSNKRVNQALRAAIPEGKERDWDIYLGYCVMALNSLRNRHSGYSSNRLVFGRENNTPISLLVDNEIKTIPIGKSTKGAFEQYSLMKKINRKVRENADVDFLYAKNQHDRNLSGPFFSAGDLCYVLINCPTHKHSIRWRGPLLVNKVINDHLYVVAIAPGKEKVINISKMKHFKRNKYNTDKYPQLSSPTGSKSTPENNLSSVPLPASTLTTPHPTKHVTFPSTSDDSDDDDQSVTLLIPKKRNTGSAKQPVALFSDDCRSAPSPSSSTEFLPPLGTPTENSSSSASQLPADIELQVTDSDNSSVIFDTISNGDPEHRESYNLRDRSTINPPDTFSSHF